jgi:Bacterial transcriptional regulator
VSICRYAVLISGTCGSTPANRAFRNRSSATGKALLAYLPRPDLDELLDRVELVQRGPRTLTSKAALLAELAQVHHPRVAVNDEELDSALHSIAAPVRQPARAGPPGHGAADRGAGDLTRPPAGWLPGA